VIAISDENVEIARQGYEAFNRGDIDALLDLCSPDIEWHDRGIFDTQPVLGKDALRAFFELVMDPWEDVRREPEEMIDLGGDQVLAMIRMTAHGKGSGIEVDVRLADVATIREGKLAHWTGYPGRRQALKAVGLAA
jgi:ketosteroid isomerase-like protein